jgi:hypothetical protein
MVPGAYLATRLSDEPFNTTSPFELAASVHQIIYALTRTVANIYTKHWITLPKAKSK